MGICRLLSLPAAFRKTRLSAWSYPAATRLFTGWTGKAAAKFWEVARLLWGSFQGFQHDNDLTFEDVHAMVQNAHTVLGSDEVDLQWGRSQPAGRSRTNG